MTLYLQLDHPAIKNIFVSSGGTVSLQHVAGVSHPVLQLLQPLGEKLVLSDYSVKPRCLLLQIHRKGHNQNITTIGFRYLIHSRINL